MNVRHALLAAFGFTTLLACKNGSSDAGEGPATRTSASAAPVQTTAAVPPAPAESAAAPAGKCEPLGCTGAGSFSEMCSCKSASAPITAKFTGSYRFDTPEWEVTNTTDSPLHWGSSAVYYYDKAGKQLSTEIRGTKYSVHRMNGSSFTLKPKETRKITVGFKKADEPKGVKSIELLLDGWCFGTYEDKASHLCVRAPKAPDERAQGAVAGGGSSDTGGDAPGPTMTVEQFKNDFRKYAGKTVSIQGVVAVPGGGGKAAVVAPSAGQPVPFVMCDDPTGNFPKGAAVLLEGMVHPTSSIAMLKTCKMQKR